MHFLLPLPSPQDPRLGVSTSLFVTLGLINMYVLYVHFAIVNTTPPPPLFYF